MKYGIVSEEFYDAVQEALAVTDFTLDVTIVQPTKEHSVDFNFINHPYIFKVEVNEHEPTPIYSHEHLYHHRRFCETQYAGGVGHLALILIRKLEYVTDVLFSDLITDEELTGHINYINFDHDWEWHECGTDLISYLDLLGKYRDRQARLEEEEEARLDEEEAPQERF